jgi:hypothetical protein
MISKHRKRTILQAALYTSCVIMGGEIRTQIAAA